MSDSGDDDYLALKPSLRRAIDTVFLKLSRKAQAQKGVLAPAQKKQRVEDQDGDSDEGGGFVKDDQDANGGSDDEAEEDQGVPLSLIPTGLQMLDLPPDDEEVLAVFRNAATGWESRPNGPSRPRKAGSGSDEDDGDLRAVDKNSGLTVSKEDWRAVCAVLVGQRADAEVEPKPKPKKPSTSGRASGSKQKAPEEPTEEPERRVTRGQARASQVKKDQVEDSGDEGGGFLAEDVGDDGGGFIPDSGDEGGFVPASDEEDALDESDSDSYSEQPPPESSDSEFGAPIQQKSTRSGKVAAPKDADSDVDMDNWEGDMPRTLTDRQLREAKLAFALFFPGMDVNDPVLNTKKLGIKEVAEAAKTLKENLSTDDIIEMLSMFSSGPSGTIGLEEFGRMAVMARLI